MLVAWIIVAHFHLCSLLGMLSRYTGLEVRAVRRPMCVCCGSQWGQCVLFINILDRLTAPCLVYSTGMYTVYGLAGAWFVHWPVRLVRGLYRRKIGAILFR